MTLLMMTDFLLSRVIFDLLCSSHDHNIMILNDDNDGNYLIDGSINDHVGFPPISGHLRSALLLR